MYLPHPGPRQSTVDPPDRLVQDLDDQLFQKALAYTSFKDETRGDLCFHEYFEVVGILGRSEIQG